MSTTIVLPTRVFKFNGLTLPDVDNTMPPEQVIAEYARSYPQLAFATLSDPVVSADGSEITFTCEPPPAKTKGAGHVAANG